MARISRKNNQMSSVTIGNKLFRTAIYTRLSLRNNKQDIRNNVIQTQIELCKEYLDKESDLVLHEVYIDDGYTGTNFNRPEFQRMLMDIKAGKIDCVLVKDLSRFGRDYIEVGTYIERIFPRLNIRFIAIKENIDSYHKDIDKKSMIMSFQNVINQSYSKDISKKVSVAHQQRMKTGNHVKGAPPYGYKLSSDKRSFVLDENYYGVVRDIYNWKLEGISYAQMLRNLDEARIPTPRDVKKINSTNEEYDFIRSKWHRASLYNILKNPTYMGDIVLGRTEDAKYKGQDKRKYRKLSECTILEDMHIPIISREDFYAVQAMIDNERDKYQSEMANHQMLREKLINIFADKIYCDDCGSKMYFHRKNGVASYECSKYEKPLSNECCSHHINMDRVTLVLKNAISNHIDLLMEQELKRKSLEKKYSLDLEKLLHSKQKLEKKVEENTDKKLVLYEKFITKTITQDEYVDSKKLLEDGVHENLRNLTKLSKKIIKIRTQIENLHNKRTINLKSDNTKIINDKELREWIEYITVDKNKNLNFNLKYQSIFECAG